MYDGIRGRVLIELSTYIKMEEVKRKEEKLKFGPLNDKVVKIRNQPRPRGFSSVQRSASVQP